MPRLPVGWPSRLSWSKSTLESERYSLAARLLHWLMAVGLVFMWACGYTMITLVEDDTPIVEFLFDLHISVGVTLPVLMLARIAIRLTYRSPAGTTRRQPCTYGQPTSCWPWC